MEEQYNEAPEDSGADERDFESEASEQGWTPQDEFRGDPDKWVDAKTFVERGSYKKQLQNSEKQIGDLSNKLSSLEKQIAEQSEQSSKKLKQELERARRVAEHALNQQKAQFEERYAQLKRQAVADGDVDEYDRLSTEQEERAKQFSEPQFEEEIENLEFEEPAKEEPKKADQPELPDDIKQTIDSWVSNGNEWFNNDQRMASYARAAHQDIIKDNPNMSLEESLNVLSTEMREAFPHKFKDGHQPSSLAGGNRINNGGAPRKKGWNDIDKEARENLMAWIESGTFKDQKAAADFYWEENKE